MWEMEIVQPSCTNIDSTEREGQPLSFVASALHAERTERNHVTATRVDPGHHESGHHEDLQTHSQLPESNHSFCADRLPRRGRKKKGRRDSSGEALFYVQMVSASGSRLRVARVARSIFRKIANKQVKLRYPGSSSLHAYRMPSVCWCFLPT